MTDRDKVIRELHDGLSKWYGGCDCDGGETSICARCFAVEYAFDAGAAAEREACAQVARHVSNTEAHELYQARSVERLIRARGEGEK